MQRFARKLWVLSIKKGSPCRSTCRCMSSHCSLNPSPLLPAQTVIREKNKLVVEGVNMVRKSERPTESTPGGLISTEMPIHYSNVNLVDPTTG